ncbi:hypothetical protein LIER_28244 [Lithospermum erythrorhizon]|uniref:Uncharacterized protein n=1 Tax=Lithospermum erythrorhizon TaxID=34254 RepID=A0AAV3RF04_LITER
MHLLGDFHSLEAFQPFFFLAIIARDFAGGLRVPSRGEWQFGTSSTRHRAGQGVVPGACLGGCPGEEAPRVASSSRCY